MGNATNFKCVAVLAFALAGCFPNAIGESTNGSKAEYAEIGDSFILSENKIAALEEASANGDSEASYDLFLHYTFSNRTAENEEKADFWLSKAAEQGYEKAKALQEKTKPADSRKLVDQIEQSIKLPEDAGELQSYARYYARHGNVVYAAYIVHSDGWREFVKEGCSLQGSGYPCNDPNFGVIESGQFRWVEKRDYLPIRSGGGCSFVEIEYDVKQKSFVKIACNGDI